MGAAARPEREISLLLDVFVASQRQRMLLTHALFDAPLRFDEHAVYTALRFLGPHSSTDLARMLAMPQTTMSDYVRTMLERGHAQRVPNPRDGRSYLVELTPEGESAQRETRKRFLEAARRMEGALTIPVADAKRVLHALDDAAAAALDELYEQAVKRAV